MNLRHNGEDFGFTAVIFLNCENALLGVGISVNGYFQAEIELRWIKSRDFGKHPPSLLRATEDKVDKSENGGFRGGGIHSKSSTI